MDTRTVDAKTSPGNELSRDDDSSSEDHETSEMTEYSGTECPLGCPAEVVVEGQQMQSVSVRFIAPRPPRTRSRDRPRSTSDSPCIRLASGQQRVRWSRNERRRDLAGSTESSPSTATDEKQLPFSHEVSCSTPDLSSSASQCGESQAKRGTSLGTGRDLDRQVRLDIENGINYLERRNDELNEVNENLERQLEAARKQLENYELKISALENDNTELKVRLDDLQTEKLRWHEQGVEEWRKRVTTEEDLVSLRASMEKEIASLKEELQRKSIELEKEKKKDNQITTAGSEDLTRLKDKVKFLKGIIRTLTAENEVMAMENVKYRNSIALQPKDTHTYKVLGTPRSSRLETNQTTAALDYRLVSTWAGKSTSKGAGKDPPKHFQLREDGFLVRESAVNKKSGISVEALPPINVKETSLSRRQWLNVTSVSGQN